MKRSARAGRTWYAAVLLFLGLAAATVKLYAVPCEFECGDCTITYVNCESCGGADCDTVGQNCTQVCWDCPGDHNCARVN